MKLALLLIALTSAQLLVSSQSKYSLYEFGINAGIMAYQGDLTPHEFGDLRTMNPTFSLYGSRNLSQKLAIRLSIAFGKLKGDDANYDAPVWRKLRNYNFHSPLTELSGIVLWNVRGLIPNDAGIVNFTPYLFAGVGYSFVNIKRDWSNFNNAHFSGQVNVTNGLNADINHTLPRGALVFPVGAGVRLGITPQLSFTAETSFRQISTDYLDGFSQGANPSLDDHYYTHSIGVIYSFGKKGKMECPVVKL